MLLEEGMIAEELVESMRSWKQVISFIDQPSVIRRILKHLDLREGMFD